MTKQQILYFLRHNLTVAKDYLAASKHTEYPLLARLDYLHDTFKRLRIAHNLVDELEAFDK